jgi:hypothetical protein
MALSRRGILAARDVVLHCISSGRRRAFRYASAPDGALKIMQPSYIETLSWTFLESSQSARNICAIASGDVPLAPRTEPSDSACSLRTLTGEQVWSLYQMRAAYAEGDRSIVVKSGPIALSPGSFVLLLVERQYCQVESSRTRIALLHKHISNNI